MNTELVTIAHVELDNVTGGGWKKLAPDSDHPFRSTVGVAGWSNLKVEVGKPEAKRLVGKAMRKLIF